MKKKKKPVETKSRLLCFVLSSTFLFALSALPVYTDAEPSLRTKFGQPDATHEADSDYLDRIKLAVIQSNETLKDWTCGSDQVCEIKEICAQTRNLEGEIEPGCISDDRFDEYERCMALPKGTGLELPGGSWCCKPEDGEVTCKKDFVDGSLLSKCTHRVCTSRYCVAIESGIGVALCPDVITDAQTRIMFDRECNDIATGTTKRLSEERWCCKNLETCDTSIRKCGSNSQCQASFCQTNGNKETICPEMALLDETTCKNLPKGKTIKLGNGISCCNADNCNTEVESSHPVQSCGGKPCTEKYCVGSRAPNKDTVITTCEILSQDTGCHNLARGQEIALDWGKVCCNDDKCLGTHRKCGRSNNCTTTFCIATRISGSNETETACPTPSEVKSHSGTCEALADGEESRIGVETQDWCGDLGAETWCCKASECPMCDTLSVPGQHLEEQVKTGGKEAGMWRTIFSVVTTLLIAACIGIAVVFYFIGKRQGTKTSPQRELQAQKQTLLAAKGTSKNTSEKRDTMDEESNVGKEAKSTRNSLEKTQNKTNLIENPRQSFDADYPTSMSIPTGTVLTRTDSSVPIVTNVGNPSA